MSKVGPSCNAKLKGVNCADIAKEGGVHSFFTKKSGHFTDFFENKAKELCNDLKDDIESLSEAINFEKKRLWQKYLIQNSKLYALLNSFRKKNGLKEKVKEKL